MNPPTDLMGRPLSATEISVRDAYVALKALCARPDLPPCVAANARFALAAAWQMVTDLAIDFEQIDP